MTDGPWAGRRVLVTGHTGFKGAWLALWLERQGAAVAGLSLPPEDGSAFTAFEPWPTLDHRVVDIRDAAAVRDALADVDPEVVFHLAAQALVRQGYADPYATYATNVVGTANVLHALDAAPSLRASVIVTSDKVYAQRGADRPFQEGDTLGGGDPYSASKALAELIVDGWRVARPDLVVASARAGNVIGGGDRGNDRLLPDVWRALEADEPVRLRHPDAVRPWQFVLEPVAGYMRLAEQLLRAPGEAPPAVNFGPDDASHVNVATVVDRVLALWGKGEWHRDEGVHPPEAHALRLDAGLAERALGWRPRLSIDEALEWTVAWWRAERAGDDLRELALTQIEAYEALR